jgi:MoxR-like ATPase
MHSEINHIQELLAGQGYVADRTIATSVYLSITLRKPLLIEGAAGVGKTEVAKVMARALDADLIRLQCYEGLDATTALYEWNYQKQLLHIRLSEGGERSLAEREAEIFSEGFLLKRPLLDAITRSQSPVLLVDEIDRADEEFEAFLLEVLSDFQVSIPEIGTIAATAIPNVVLTSNRTRELGDALRRRCLYLWIDYPTFEKELEIVRRKVPAVNGRLAEQISAFMQLIRRLRLEKAPGVAETLDWSAALMALHRDHLDRAAVEETLGVLFKHHDDAAAVRAQWLDQLLDGVAALEQEGRPWSQEAVVRAAERLAIRR